VKITSKKPSYGNHLTTISLIPAKIVKANQLCNLGGLMVHLH